MEGNFRRFADDNNDDNDDYDDDDDDDDDSRPCNVLKSGNCDCTALKTITLSTLSAHTKIL